MSNRSPQGDFSRTRARIQRLRDAKLFGAWVSQLVGNRVLVRRSPDLECRPGDLFHFQLFGKDSSLLFPAEFVVETQDVLVFEIQKPPRQVASSESPRINVRGLIGRATVEASVIDLEIVDMSLEGMGALANEPIPQGTEVDIEVSGPPGTVTGKAHVRNCRETVVGGTYRIGFEVTAIDRTNQARWRSYFSEAA